MISLCSHSDMRLPRLLLRLLRASLTTERQLTATVKAGPRPYHTEVVPQVIYKHRTAQGSTLTLKHMFLLRGSRGDWILTH